MEIGVKVVLPVYIIMTLFSHTSGFEAVSRFMTPVMGFVGLPGEAALPLSLATLVNVYAGIGAILPLGFNTKELTIVAAMVLFAHELPIETAINKKTGSPVLWLVAVRVFFALAAGWLINMVM
ncbi:MAG: nucleoside recognition domain-containing protein [Syntrophomonadaceae bacterium]|jgi:spore maturation protein SpmB